MDHVLKKRLRSPVWRIVETAGWILIAGTLLWTAQTSRQAKLSLVSFPELLKGAAAVVVGLLVGAVLVRRARRSATHYYCARCGGELRGPSDRACPRCLQLIG